MTAPDLALAALGLALMSPARRRSAGKPPAARRDTCWEGDEKGIVGRLRHGD
jgi:hypothetical protein